MRELYVEQLQALAAFLQHFKISDILKIKVLGAWNIRIMFEVMFAWSLWMYSNFVKPVRMSPGPPLMKRLNFF